MQLISEEIYLTAHKWQTNCSVLEDTQVGSSVYGLYVEARPNIHAGVQDEQFFLQ